MSSVPCDPPCHRLFLQLEGCKESFVVGRREDKREAVPDMPEELAREWSLASSSAEGRITGAST